MNNRLLGTTIAGLFAVGAAGAAFAESPMQDQSVNPASAATTPTDTVPTDTMDRGALASTPLRDFTTFDADANGSLTTAELASDTELASNFNALDDNGDGMLSQAEFDGHLQLGQSDDDTVEDEE